MTTSIARLATILVAVPLACAASGAIAQKALTDFAGRDPGVQDIIRALKPAEMREQPTTRVRTRAIKFANQPAAAPAAEEAPDETADNAAREDAGPRKASFDQIQFQFDSANLTPNARRMLDRIGEALASDELKGLRFVVEGHTDGVGPDEYNLALSQRRADTVHRYLTGRFGIPSRTLAAVGKGELELLDPAAPASPVNRRVVIGVVDRR